MKKVAKKLYRLLDYQKFEGNARLDNVLSASTKYELNSSQLLAAVGGIDKPKPKIKKKDNKTGK